MRYTNHHLGSGDRRQSRSGIFLTANNAPLAVIKEEMKVNFGRDTPFTMVVCNLVCGFLNH